MARRSRKDAIIEAAAELFAAKGFRATTVRDIAEEAGVLSGSLYAHIDTKEDLYLEIVRRAGADFTQAVRPFVENSEQTARDQLSGMIGAHLGVIARSRAWARVYLEDDNQLSQAARVEARQLRREYERLWDGVFATGMAAGDFQVWDEPLARLFVLSALNGVSRWYRPDGRLSLEQVSEIYRQYIFRTLGTD